jgi:hypothetical protein
MKALILGFLSASLAFSASADPCSATYTLSVANCPGEERHHGLFGNETYGAVEACLSWGPIGPAMTNWLSVGTYTLLELTNGPLPFEKRNRLECIFPDVCGYHSEDWEICTWRVFGEFSYGGGYDESAKSKMPGGYVRAESIAVFKVADNQNPFARVTATIKSLGKPDIPLRNPSDRNPVEPIPLVPPPNPFSTFSIEARMGPYRTFEVLSATNLLGTWVNETNFMSDRYGYGRVDIPIRDRTNALFFNVTTTN